MKKTTRKTVSALLLTALLLMPQTALAGEKEKDKTDYEAVRPQYRYDEAATVKKPENPSSRYVKRDGIYVNPGAKDTGEATLMITGDLMCQYRQQLAQFVSSGEDYISYEEYKQILKQALEKQHEGIKTDSGSVVAFSEAQADSGEKSGEDTGKNSGEAGTSQKPGASDETGSAGDPDETGSTGDRSETGDTDGTQEEEIIPALPDSTVSVPALDLGVIPQPKGTWDFSQSFRYVKEILQKGDLTIGNLETMVSQSSPLGMQIRRLEDRPYLNAPASFLDALKYAGYDLLTMANNHNIDTGERGIYETLQNVEDWGFMHTGLFSSAEDERYIIVEVNGIRIGIVSYASYFNTKDNNLTESGQDVLLNRYGRKKARADIRAARDAGAEYIIAFIHWGAENTHQTTDNQAQYARTLAEAGADYIVGSHPHALQRQDMITTSDLREVPVIYSMGNFLSSMQNDINNDTIILQLNLKRDEDGKVVVASHRIYPAAVLESMTVRTGENGNGSGSAAGVSSGTGSVTKVTRTDSYIIVPQQEKYHSLIDSTTTEGKKNLEFLEGSLKRTMNVFSNRTVLPLPYDPYDIESDEPAASLISPKSASNHLQWLLSNLAA